MSKNVNIQDILRLAVCSDMRSEMLISLNEGKKSLGDIRKRLNISSTTAIHALRELEKGNLTFQDKDKSYSLTSIGKIIALKLQDFNDAAEVLKKHEKFWLEHDLSGIPEHMMEKIGWLKDSTIVEDVPIDIFKSHTTFLKLLETAKEIRGVSPIFHPEYPTLIGELVDKKVDIEIIVTNKVLNKILEVSEISLKKMLYNKNFTLLVLSEDAKIAFTLTDKAVHLGLFAPNGTYDYNRDLIGYDAKSLSWGRLLYEHYRQKSKEVGF